jgi:hypothetical protein
VNVIQYLAAPQASIPALFTSIASAITALTVLLGGITAAVKVVVPLLRETRHNTAQLNVIHTLVNSTLTAALQSELDATRRERMLLREIVVMRKDGGHDATDEQAGALEAIDRKIRDLTQAMVDRADQTRMAEIQIETERMRQSRA